MGGDLGQDPSLGSASYSTFILESVLIQAFGFPAKGLYNWLGLRAIRVNDSCWAP